MCIRVCIKASQVETHYLLKETVGDEGLPEIIDVREESDCFSHFILTR